jgi:hypothetical protein
MALLLFADTLERAMKVLPFEQSTRPVSTPAEAPAKQSDAPDRDPARTQAPEESHGHDEPGYGHGV